jgi:hypothetical protein
MPPDPSTRLTHAQVLGAVLNATYTVASRRTTQAFAATVLGAIIKTLEQNYPFLKNVSISDREVSGTNVIGIDRDIDTINHEQIGKAVEAIIRIIYMDLVGKTGLFFLKELKEQAGEDVISELRSYGVDLALLQTEQRYLHRQHRKKTRSESDVSLLGYTWKNVGSWKFDPLQKTCLLYDKDGKELDRLDLDTIIESYVTHLTHEEDELPTEATAELHLSNNEIELLKMLSSRDLDAETAEALLHVSKNEFETMISHLLRSDLLHYVSHNEIELTEEGMSLISSKTQPVSSTV